MHAHLYIVYCAQIRTLSTYTVHKSHVHTQKFAAEMEIWGLLPQTDLLLENPSSSPLRTPVLSLGAKYHKTEYSY
jgi:hypothetical protein